MINVEKKNLERILKALKEAQNQQSRRVEELAEFEEVCLKSRIHRNGSEYYYVREKGSRQSTYIGRGSDVTVNSIKESKYLRKSLSIIEGDINCLEQVLERLQPVDYDSIDALLPKIYRGAKLIYAEAANEKLRLWKEQALAYKARFNTYRPEELKIVTKDGTYVRSKSEALIYNALLDLGLTFVYEMPMRIGTKTYWADFVILSEQDYETEIILEHQGLMNSERYRMRFIEKLHGYWKSGYIMGVNIFFTFDNPDGGLDLTPVYDAVNNHIKRA